MSAAAICVVAGGDQDAGYVSVVPATRSGATQRLSVTGASAATTVRIPNDTTARI